MENKGRLPVTYLIPHKIKMIMQEIEKTGRSAFVVGGAVRDLLVGREPKDYDLATDARPQEIIALAKRAGWKTIDQLGQNFGVVAVVVESEPVEIATYRTDCYDSDACSPAMARQADNLAEDLSRRDFTFNAMALSMTGELYDPFGGRADLANGLIRAVGMPEQRFAEDALRMFRACRLAAEFGFSIDQSVLDVIPDQLDRVAGLSLERVREEIRRILLAKWPSRGMDALVRSGLAGAECSVRLPDGSKKVPILPELLHLVDMPQNPRFHRYDVWQHTLRTVEGAPCDLTLRWAALLHDVAKGLPGIRGAGEGGKLTDYGHDKVGAEIAAEILQRFGLNKRFRNRVVWLISRHMRVTVWRNDDSGPVWHWLRTEARSGNFRSSAQLAEAFFALGQLCLSDMAATGTVTDLSQPEAFARRLALMAGQMPVGTGDLRYNTDALRAIFGGVELMEPFLKNILTRVQDRVLENSERAVEEAARRWMKRAKRRD